MFFSKSKAEIGAEAVKRIDVLFAIGREINGLTAEERLVRQERGRPLIFELEAWLRQQRAKLSKNNNTTKAINYCPSRWDVFAASSAMGACACRTMPPNASYWPSPYEEETKSLQAQMRARGRSMPSPLLPCRSNLAGLGIHAALERPILRVATNLSKLIETLALR